MMHKSVAGEFSEEVDNTTDLLDDILSILALLEAGDWVSNIALNRARRSA